MKRKIMSMGVALSICMCALFGTGCSNPDVNNAINGALRIRQHREKYTILQSSW